ncbi:hypothetical protein [Streptomyces sp. NBC_01367]|uniref:hypothetical protein n=1 Tax=Streptomyces sp. NBC_01367 TaxID=2903841 RepID=UPI00325314F0
MDILPEREAGLLVSSRQWPLLAACMQKIGESEGTHVVARHLNRLTADTSWKQATGTALVGRVVDAAHHSLTTPPSASPASVSRLWVSPMAARSRSTTPAAAAGRLRPKPPSPPTDSRPRPPRERGAGADRSSGPGRERLFQTSGTAARWGWTTGARWLRSVCPGAPHDLQ